MLYRKTKINRYPVKNYEDKIRLIAVTINNTYYGPYHNLNNLSERNFKHYKHLLSEETQLPEIIPTIGDKDFIAGQK